MILTLGYPKILTSSKVGQIILICICPFKNRISFNFKTGVQCNTESIKKNAALHTVFCIKKRRGHQIYNIYKVTFYSQPPFTPCSIPRSILSHLLVTNCVSFVELKWKMPKYISGVQRPFKTCFQKCITYLYKILNSIKHLIANTSFLWSIKCY